MHADIDDGRFDRGKADKLAALGGFAITSGSSGNAHAYVPLSKSVSVDDHEALCMGLQRHLGGADKSKKSDNDLLRPPGTFNHKPRTFGDQPPAPVRWVGL